MATRASSRLLQVVLVAWVVFGGWALFRPAGDSAGLDPLVGHFVVFFFIALAMFGVLWRPLGPGRTLLMGGLGIVTIAAVSEILQPILTATRRAQQVDFLANLAGIVAAVVLTGLLVATFARTRRRELATVVMCCVGLVGSAVVLLAGVGRIEVAFTCRGGGFDPIPSVTGQPVIHVDGATGQLGGQDTRPLGDGILAPNSSDLRCSVLRSGEYSIVATVVPESLDSGGPTRIFTSSIGTNADEYNTHIGQDFDELSIRIRSGKREQWESIPGVFAAGERVTIAVTVADGEAHVYVDGELRETIDLVGESFVEWDEDFVVMVGDEFTRNRTFEGEIEMVSFFDRALDAERDASVLRGPR